MRIEPLAIPHAFRIWPEHHHDNRGRFFEALRYEALSEAIGYPFRVGQVNYSVSKRNTLRGIHTTELPPGQAKLVTCVRGAAIDIAVDLRVGSPTFGQYEVTQQDPESGVAVYMADGVGHAFLAPTDDTCMSYICAEEYVPGTMIDVDARDPELGLPLPLTEPPSMSEKDANAPSVAEAVASGRLPTWEDCLEYYQRLADGTAGIGTAGANGSRSDNGNGASLTASGQGDRR